MDDESLQEKRRFEMTTTSNGSGAMVAAQPQKAAVKMGSHGVKLTSIDEMFRFAMAVSKSGIAPRGLQKPEQILVAIEYGAELGLRPMQSLATVMVVNGRATLYGDGMLAVAQASGLLVDINETVEGNPKDLDKMAATCVVKRQGRPTPSRCTFSWADAKQAGLTGSDTYKKFPGRMLKARARAFALRDAFPDVLCGVMSTDEAADLEGENETHFVEGATQAPTDLDTLMDSDAFDGEVVEHDPLTDDNAPSEDDLKRDGLFSE